ncbi:MAG: hypothetical protein PVI34_05975 [Desulfobacterales bacterium]
MIFIFTAETLSTLRMKTVTPECDTILTARDLGISFGDRENARSVRLPHP